MGCNNITVDSDGNNYSIIPILLEAGINGFLPIEVAAGMDPLELRKIYGKNLWLFGGIDKRVLSENKKAIEQEIFKKLPVLLSEGGYIPSIDHAVPPNVPLNNYKFYVELVRSITNKI